MEEAENKYNTCEIDLLSPNDIESSVSSNSPISVISDDEFAFIRNGWYVKFENVDDNIELDNISEKSPKEINTNNNPVEELRQQFEQVENVLKFKLNYKEVIDEIKSLQISSKPEELFSPLCVLEKQSEIPNNEFSKKLPKRPSFLQRIKSERYSGIFRKKSKSTSVPKIVVSPGSPRKDEDSGNDSDSSIYNENVDKFGKWSLNQKLFLKQKKKQVRKSI